MTTAQELIAELPGNGEAIPLPLVRKLINDRVGPWDRNAQVYAVKQGAIRPLEKIPGPVAGGRPRKYQGGNGLSVDYDQAVLILVAAVLAFAAAVSVVAMIRALRASGLDPAAFIPKT